MEQSIANLEFKPEIFDPNKDTLNKVKEEVSKITADPEKITKEELETVSETRKTLVKYRTGIKARGKEVRDGAIKFQKDVIAYEKELIEIIEPEEKRLKEIEDGAKKYAMRQARLETLPEYKEKLASIGDSVEISDDELLDMDPTQFQQYYNDRREAHFNALEEEKKIRDAEEAAAKEAEEKRIANEAAEAERKKKEAELAIYNSRVQQLLSLGMKDTGEAYVIFDPEQPNSDFRLYNFGKIALKEFNGDWEKTFAEIEIIANSAKKKASEIEAARIEKEKADAVEQAKKEAEEKARQEAAAAEEARLAAEKAEQEKKEAEAVKAAEEKAEREQAEAYQKWLSDNSYNDETDIVHETSPGTFILYRQVSKYTEQKPVIE